MLTNIQQTVFEQKPSFFTGRLAISTPAWDASYGDIGVKVSSLSGLIRKFCVGGDVLGGALPKKIVVIHGDRMTGLLVALACMKLCAGVVLVDPGWEQEVVGALLAAEAPELVIAGGMDGYWVNICKEWDGPCLWLEGSYAGLGGDDLAGYAGYDRRVRLGDINASLGLGIYCSARGEKLSFDLEGLRRWQEGMSEQVGVLEGDRYLVVGEISFAGFVLETLWCLFQGIHSLHYPFAERVIGRLRPDEEHFPMEFGLFFFGSAKDDPGEESCYELLMGCVKHADQHDYRAIWTPERHFNEFGGKYPNPSVLSAAIAAVTGKIQIRTGSIVAPLHHVVRIAEDWSVIDNLSGGRTAISFASGWQCNDFIFFPERYGSRHQAMLQLIGDFRKLWAGEKLEFPNGAGDPVKVGIFPRPVQQEMPVWVTVSGRIETFIDAGRIGANILTHLLWQEPEDLIQKIQAYRESLRYNGFDPETRTVSVMLHTYVGKTQEEVRRLVEKPLKAYVRSSLNLIEAMAETAKATGGNNAIGRYARHGEPLNEEEKEALLAFALERFLSSTSLLGDQEHCDGIMRMLRSYGVDELACLVDFGLDNETILSGLDELDKLKERYQASTLKRYPGHLILRIAQEDLERLSDVCPEEVELCRRIVTDDELYGSGSGAERAAQRTEDISL